MNILKKTAILLILAILANAILFAFIWAHHTFVTGLNPFLGLVFLFLFLLIVLPLMFFSIRRATKGWIDFTPAMAFILGIFVLLIGALTNQLNMENSTLDIQLHDTYFVIAHVHLMLFFTLLFLAFAAVYFIFPRITGRRMNAPMGYIHFVLTLVPVYLLCLPDHYEGLAGMPRRYVDYSAWVNFYGFSGGNIFAGRVMIVLLCAQLIFLVNLVYSSVRRG